MAGCPRVLFSVARLGIPFAALALLCSCSSTMRSPQMGVTGEFYNFADSGSVDLSRYDFGRLGKGYGLCVFSYDFRGDAGNRISGIHRQVKKGIRVWEYQFRTGDWDIKQLERRIMFWGYPCLYTLGLTSEGLDVRTHPTFHKGRIVYGGRLLIDMPPPSRDDVAAVQMRFTEDVGPWLKSRPAILDSIKIDTALIQVY